MTAFTTFLLIGLGGLVTSHEAGMSVPDWPNTYGYNIRILFPLVKDWIGGIFYEHTHRSARVARRSAHDDSGNLAPGSKIRVNGCIGSASPRFFW